MTRAEQRALEAYPRDDDKELNFRRANYRIAYERGYEQAEKDLALTWEDIERIEHYCEQVNREHNMGTFRGTPYGKSFYKEVSRRFNKAKEDKK